MKKIALGLLLLMIGFSNPTHAAARFLVGCVTTCTWDGSGTTIWSTTSGGAGGASVPGSSDDVTLNANSCSGGTTCTITVNTTVNIGSLTMGACTASTTGCILDFSVNNNNVTLNDNSGISVGGSGTRTLRMGSGLWTVLAAFAGISFSPTTNLTFTPGASTFKITGATTNNRIFTTGGLTFNNLVIDANSSGGGVQLSNNSATFANITMNAPTQLFIPTGQTTTATSLTLSGSQGSVLYLSTTSTTGAIATVSVASGTQTMNWIGINDVTFTGGATFVANNSLNLGINSGITISPPSSGGGGCILGGWLLWRDFNPANDNLPAVFDEPIKQAG